MHGIRPTHQRPDELGVHPRHLRAAVVAAAPVSQHDEQTRLVLVVNLGALADLAPAEAHLTAPQQPQRRPDPPSLRLARRV